MAWESLGKIVVPTAGSPVQLSTGRQSCHAILIQANFANTGKIYIGRSNMNSTTLVGCLAVLAVPTTNNIPSANAGIPAAPNSLNLADYWIDAQVSSESVLVSYLVL